MDNYIERSYYITKITKAQGKDNMVEEQHKYGLIIINDRITNDLFNYTSKNFDTVTHSRFLFLLV